jgi:hypothetical protein
MRQFATTASNTVASYYSSVPFHDDSGVTAPFDALGI